MILFNNTFYILLLVLHFNIIYMVLEHTFLEFFQGSPMDFTYMHVQLDKNPSNVIIQHNLEQVVGFENDSVQKFTPYSFYGIAMPHVNLGITIKLDNMNFLI